MTAPILEPKRARTLPNRVRHLLTSPRGVVGLCVTLIMLVLALLSLFGLLPHDPLNQVPASRFLSPSFEHIFGTDQFGRDVFSRAATGVGSSMQVAIVAVTLSALVGTFLGVSAGFFRGLSDSVVSALTNILFAFPPLLLALTLASVIERNWFTVAIAIAIVYVPIFIRVTRGPVLSLREIEYVRASVSTGQSRLSIMLRHVLPNISPTIIVQVTLSLSWAVLTEASLSYLGLGTPPPIPSLGSMVFDARALFYVAPWMMVGPGIMIALLILGLNLLGDALRDVFDPRTSR